MDTRISPVPERRDTADVMARMDRFRETGQEELDKKAVAGSKSLLVLSCVLSACSILLLICTLGVVCAPESALARLVASFCGSMI